MLDRVFVAVRVTILFSVRVFAVLMAMLVWMPVSVIVFVFRHCLTSYCSSYYCLTPIA
jgi:hypothetical protein